MEAFNLKLVTLVQARFALEIFFEGVEGTPSLGRVEGGATTSEGALRIGDRVTLTHEPNASYAHGFAVMEWEAGARGDMIADAIVATLMQVATVCLPQLWPCLLVHPG